MIGMLGLTIFGYALREITFRMNRSIVTLASVAIAVLAAIFLSALAAAYGQAIRAPVATVGADVVVQDTGDIPLKLEGLVFPHPNARLKPDAIAAISGAPGVISVTRGVYMWELAPDHYQAILGIEDNEIGLKSLSQRLTQGKRLGATDRAVLLDSDFATKRGLKAGDPIKIAEATFPIAGVVDAARGGKVARADVYMPLTLAQELAADAPQVRALYPFGRDDANMLLVKVDRQHLEAAVAAFAGYVGKKAIISSELSFRDALSGVLFLSDRMGGIVAALIGVFASAFVFRATTSAVQERRRDMAVLQAVGWPWRAVRRLVLAENVTLAAAGAAIGVALALLILFFLGGVTVTIDLPWDISSTPHFIPEATLDRTQTITAPIQTPWAIAGLAGAASLLVSLVAALVATLSPPAETWTLLRSE